MKSPRLVALAALFAAGCIFTSPDPPSLGNNDTNNGGGGSNNGTANNGENNGMPDMGGDNNGIPDAGNNGTSNNNGSNNMTGDMGGTNTDPDMGMTNNPDAGELCGNGVVDEGEPCDSGIFAGEGACPRAIDQCETTACQSAIIVGHPDMCTAECVISERSCGPTDGCCPDGCSADMDEDCGSSCGNGVIEGAERCDGDCPTAADCDDGNVCTADQLIGSASTCDAVCESSPINSCVDDDGCCPTACDFNNDNDCSADCGNGVIDDGETCDGDCPDPASCDDGDACTADTFEGSADNCNAVCRSVAITACAADGCCAPGCNANNDPDCAPDCGNSVVETGEICDGDCPASCDDGMACTEDIVTGGAATCDLECSYMQLTCNNDVADGCCAPGCNANNDPDCAPSCGNGVVETGETCDGDCPAVPADCDDSNACTTDTVSGDANNCQSQCVNSAVTSCANGDGCCPVGCNSANDNDCSASCGNNIIEAGETCDGNCPTDQTCKAQNACTQLSGSAGQCNAFCAPIQGCKTCDRNGTCACADGEECNNGRCEVSDGDGCTNACDEAAFCKVWGGANFVCNDANDLCVRCVQDADCPSYQTCSNANSCTTPPSCNLAPDGDAWCQQQNGTGFVCDGSTCRKKCSTDGDCGTIQHCAASGFCETAPNCIEANVGAKWCIAKGTGNWCDKLQKCVYQCPSGCTNCGDQTDGCRLSSDPDGGTASACLDVTSCNQACKPNAWCTKSVNDAGATCALSFKNATGNCSSYKSCLSNSDCAYGWEYCYAAGTRFAECRPSPDCASAKSGSNWCGYFQGVNNAFCKSNVCVKSF